MPLTLCTFELGFDVIVATVAAAADGAVDAPTIAVEFNRSL